MENTNEKELFEVAEIQLVYNGKVKPSLRHKISSSRDAFNILNQTWDAAKVEFIEQFRVILTNRAQKILGIVEISTGGVSDAGASGL